MKGKAREWICKASKREVNSLPAPCLFPREMKELADLVASLQNDNTVLDKTYLSKVSKEILKVKKFENLLSELTKYANVRHPSSISVDEKTQTILMIWVAWCIIVEISNNKTISVLDCSESIPIEVYLGESEKDAAKVISSLFP